MASFSRVSDTTLDIEYAGIDLDGDSSSLPEDLEGGPVPASSSPVASSPFPGTPPDDDDFRASSLPEGQTPALLSQEPLVAISSSVSSTHTTTSGFTDTSGWTKESQGQDLSVSGYDSPQEVEGPLADEYVDSLDHSSFASRLHELLLVAQQERLARRTVSVSSCIDATESAVRVPTPSVVDPVNVASEVADSPDYWSYFPESAAVAIACNDGSADSSSSNNSAASAYSQSESHLDARHGSKGAYIHSSVPSVDPGSAKTTVSTPVVSRKRSLASACSPMSTGNPTCDAATSSGDQSEAKKKRTKHEHKGDRPDALPIRSKYFPRRPSLDIAAKQRSLDDADEDNARFLPKRRMYARRAASLRRADSLRSEAASSIREPNKSRVTVSLHICIVRPA